MRLFHILENRVFSFSVDSLFCCYLKNSLILSFEYEFHECPFYPPTRKGSGDIAISLASVRLSVRLSVRRQKLVRSITFIPFEIF